jgi:hypothetical protein
MSLYSAVVAVVGGSPTGRGPLRSYLPTFGRISRVRCL